jgi:hypothetical protein
VTSTQHREISWQERARTALEAIVIVACSLVLAEFLVGLCLLLFTGNNPGHHDVVSFWAAGQQIDRHANPYDSDSILKLERSAGFGENQQALIVRNPPPALGLMMPLGLLASRPAAIFWSLLLLAGLMLSVHLLWQMHGRPDNKLHLLAYAFGPALSCILSGQTAIFALVGLVLFLRLQQRHQFAAGLSLWLCALKPHLFLPFGVGLVVWIVATRAYRLLAGTVAALAFSSWVAWHFDPAIWTQYSQMMRSAGLEHEFIPCFGVALRFAIKPAAMWLQYIPAAIASAWAIRFYWTHRRAWDWQTHGALLMMVSILCSPYAWMTDQALLIPAVLVGVYRATSRAQLYVPALASAFIEMVPLLGRGMHSALYLGTPPLLLAWFLYVSAKSRAAITEADPASHGVLTQPLPA